MHEDLGDFVTAVDDVPELASLLENPEIDRAAKAEHARGAARGRRRARPNFLLLLVEKGRIAELHEIAREVDSLVAALERRLEVHVTTAVELSDEEARELVQQIETSAGRKVEATRDVDPSLIGGLVLQVGSRRVDASVRGRFDRLRRELLTRS